MKFLQLFRHSVCVQRPLTRVMQFYPEDVEEELIQDVTQRLFYLQVKQVGGWVGGCAGGCVGHACVGLYQTYRNIGNSQSVGLVLGRCPT